MRIEPHSGKRLRYLSLEERALILEDRVAGLCKFLRTNS